jgi:hypothetical protein
VPHLYINTYEPLAATAAGRGASERRSIPPFVDGSIRREPDLEHQYPSISCLCRGDKFAPRLGVGDVVVYMTKKARYGGPTPHWRMTAVLEVAATFDTHTAAAAWYRGQGLSAPNNCMVEGTVPHPVSESHRHNKHRQPDEERWRRLWDAGYAARARKHGRFVACRPLWRELTWDAPVVHESDLKAVFGRVPGTRNPGALEINDLPKLAERLGIPLPPRAP